MRWYAPKYASHRCQRCGANVGYSGRMLEWLRISTHDCIVTYEGLHMRQHTPEENRALSDLNTAADQLRDQLASAPTLDDQLRAAVERNASHPEAEIRAAINRHSAENRSDTPDFILAKYLIGCLDAYSAATRERDRWYGLYAGKPISTADVGPAPESPPPQAAPPPPGESEARMRRPPGFTSTDYGRSGGIS